MLWSLSALRPQGVKRAHFSFSCIHTPCASRWCWRGTRSAHSGNWGPGWQRLLVFTRSLGSCKGQWGNHTWALRMSTWKDSHHPHSNVPDHRCTSSAHTQLQWHREVMPLHVLKEAWNVYWQTGQWPQEQAKQWPDRINSIRRKIHMNTCG